MTNGPYLLPTLKCTQFQSHELSVISGQPAVKNHMISVDNEKKKNDVDNMMMTCTLFCACTRGSR